MDAAPPHLPVELHVPPPVRAKAEPRDGPGRLAAPLLVPLLFLVPGRAQSRLPRRQRMPRQTEAPVAVPAALPQAKTREDQDSLSDGARLLGVGKLKPFQRQMARAALDGKDCCVYMATGSGKSLCFQLPALVPGKVVFVVSPLIALMKEQVLKFNQRLEEQGSEHRACFLGSGHEDMENRHRMDEAALRGDFSLVYVTPEKLTQSSNLLCRLRPLVKQGRLALLAVDEAHSISEWGGEFRPCYREIGFFREDYPEVPIMALSAIKTPSVKDDIVEHLQLRSPEVVQGSAYRPNLVLKRSLPSKGDLDLQRIAEEVRHEGERSIIYVNRRKDAEEVGAKLEEILKRENISVGIYHAERSQRKRDQAHHNFSDEGAHIMVATVAYGLGIDFPNIRRVYHLTAPTLVERYYQQIGRAGRDGKPAVCELIASDSEFAKPPDSPTKWEGWQTKSFKSMRNLIYSSDCLWDTLLRYLGEEPPFENGCGSCDVCKAQEQHDDVTRASKIFLEAVKFFEEHKSPQPLTWILSLICNKKSLEKQFPGQIYQEQGAELLKRCKDMGFNTHKEIDHFYKQCLVPLLVSQNFLRRRRKTHGPWFHQRSYEVYQLTSAGYRVIEAKMQVLLQIPPSLQDAWPLK